MIEISAQPKAGERPRQTQGDNDHLASQVDSLTRLHELAMRLGGIAELKPALHAILATAVRPKGRPTAPYRSSARRGAHSR